MVYDEATALAKLSEEIENCGGKPGAPSGSFDNILFVATRQSEKAGLVRAVPSRVLRCGLQRIQVQLCA